MDYTSEHAALELLPQLPPILESYVYKQGRLMRRWSTRRLVLKHGALIVFKDKGDQKPMATHVFDLASHSFDLRLDQSSRKGTLFTVSSPHRTHWFAVPEGPSQGGHVNASDWVKQCRALARHVRSGPRMADFTKLKQLGKGGQGQVFLVRHNGSGELFAVKRMRKRPVEAARAAPRFRTSVERRDEDKDLVSHVVHERATLQRASLTPTLSRFVTKLEFTAQDHTYWYLGTKYCAGGDLFKLMRSLPARRFSETQVRRWAAQIAVALEELHEQGIAHRDIKPENILIDADGNAHLTDFGYAKDLSSNGGRSNSFCGTKYYIPPEMLRMGQQHGTSADWWSFGVLLFELLTGRPPWAIKAKAQLYDAILNDPVEFPSGSKGDLSPEAMSLIVTLLKKQPEKRPDAAGVRSHPFFSSVDWDAVRDGEDTTAVRRPPQPPSPAFRRSGGMLESPVVQSAQAAEAVARLVRLPSLPSADGAVELKQPTFLRVPSGYSTATPPMSPTEHSRSPSIPPEGEPLTLLGWDWTSPEFQQAQQSFDTATTQHVEALSPLSYQPSLQSVNEGDSSEDDGEPSSDDRIVDPSSVSKRHSSLAQVAV